VVLLFARYRFARRQMLEELALSEIIETCGPAESVVLHAGEFLFQEGDEAHALYVVKKGVLRVISGSIVYETVRAGGIVGEMAIIDERARSASVIAGTYSELIEVDVAKFLSLIATTPSFALTIMRVMARRLRIMDLRYGRNLPA
jgi:CRP/FNR family cyclic AMP-dependent transcriptional regulator